MLLSLLLTVHASSTRVLLVNGGASSSQNASSHLMHLQEVHRVLVDRGVSAADITVFDADGPDPAADRLTA